MTTDTQAAVAAALMQAAKAAMGVSVFNPAGSQGEINNAVMVLAKVEKAILALIPADAMAALEAVKAEAAEKFEHTVSDTISCWIATRLNGGSASMNCDGNINVTLLKALDENLLERVKAVARDPYADGVKRVAETPAPECQRFPIGLRVKVERSLWGPIYGAIEYTYAHAYGGDNVRSYSIMVDGIGSVSWFDEGQIIPIDAAMEGKQ